MDPSRKVALCPYSVTIIILLVGISASSADSSTAELGEVPHLASIWMVKQSMVSNWNHTDFQCAGVLITDQHVITTINCIEQSNVGYGNVVSTGHVYRGDFDSLLFHDVTEVIRHELYDNVTKEHDIAILKIHPGVSGIKNAKPIKISKSSVDVGDDCDIAGWRTSFYFTTRDLRTNEVEILDYSLCTDLQSNKVSEEKEQPRETLTAYVVNRVNNGTSQAKSDIEVGANGRKICAGKKNAKECNVGDEGGPLVCDDMLTGLFSSYGTVCLHTSPEPSLYHDIAYYSNWIRTHAPGARFEGDDSGGNAMS